MLSRFLFLKIIMKKELLVSILLRIAEEIELWNVSDDDMYIIGYKKCLADVSFLLGVEINEKE